MDRVILHCDLNNFYASVECLYNPEIRDKPVAVCGDPDLRHGIVLAKNNIAKKYGIKTGEVIWQAKKKCSPLVVVKPNYSLYLRFSKEAREIYNDYTDKIESFGIDECWLDVTESAKVFGSGEKIANEIRQRVKDELGITVSIGVSFNKIFAKLGSDLKKPDAVTVITKENYKKLVWPLPVEDLLYIGSATKAKLYKVNITTIGRLANTPIHVLKSMFGKWGEIIWNFANGLDNTPIIPNSLETSIKGIGNSMTLPYDLNNNSDVLYVFYVLAESVAERLRKHHFKCRTIQIYIRDNNLFSIERQETMETPTYISDEIAKKAFEIFTKNWNWIYPIRSLGIRTTNLVPSDIPMQMDVFEGYRRFKKEEIEKRVDDIRKRFGHYSIQRALMLINPKLNANPIEENIIHPISYFR
ncbi:DNA polymerase IV [Caldicellulosiruptoraceae bacterium PP1]